MRHFSWIPHHYYLNVETGIMSSTPEKTKKTEKKPSVPYKKLILEAIVELKDKTGSSIPAIEKYIKEHHPEVELNHTRVRLIIKMMLEKSEIAPHFRHKNSYRIVPQKGTKKTAKKPAKEEEKEEKKPAKKTEKKAAKKPAKKEEKKEKAEKKTSKKTTKKEKAEKKPAKKSEKKEKAPKKEKAAKKPAKKTEKKEKPAKKAEKKSEKA